MESSGPGDRLDSWDGDGEAFRMVPQFLSGQLDEEEEQIRLTEPCSELSLYFGLSFTGASVKANRLFYSFWWDFLSKEARLPVFCSAERLLDSSVRTTCSVCKSGGL